MHGKKLSLTLSNTVKGENGNLLLQHNLRTVESLLTTASLLLRDVTCVNWNSFCRESSNNKAHLLHNTFLLGCPESSCNTLSILCGKDRIYIVK